MGSGTVMMYALIEIAVLAVLVFAVFPLVLSGANRVISRFWPPYARTLATVFLTGIVANLVAFVLNSLLGTSFAWFIAAANVVVTALVGGAIMNAMVHRKDGGPIGYARASAACLVLGIAVFLILMALAPFQVKMAAKLKAILPKPVSATSAPAAPASAPVSAASIIARATTVPAGATPRPAATTLIPARAASTP